MITANVPRMSTLFVSPGIRRAGIPKPTSKITKIIGMPRKRSTYTVARNLKGVSAGDREVRSSAIERPKIATHEPAIMVSMTLMVNPNKYITKNAPTSEIGMVTTGISVVLQSRKKKKMIKQR